MTNGAVLSCKDAATSLGRSEQWLRNQVKAGIADAQPVTTAAGRTRLFFGADEVERLRDLFGLAPAAVPPDEAAFNLLASDLVRTQDELKRAKRKIRSLQQRLAAAEDHIETLKELRDALKMTHTTPHQSHAKTGNQLPT